MVGGQKGAWWSWDNNYNSASLIQGSLYCVLYSGVPLFRGPFIQGSLYSGVSIVSFIQGSLYSGVSIVSFIFGCSFNTLCLSQLPICWVSVTGEQVNKIAVFGLEQELIVALGNTI